MSWTLRWRDDKPRPRNLEFGVETYIIFLQRLTNSNSELLSIKLNQYFSSISNLVINWKWKIQIRINICWYSYRCKIENRTNKERKERKGENDERESRKVISREWKIQGRINIASKDKREESPRKALKGDKTKFWSRKTRKTLCILV